MRQMSRSAMSGGRMGWALASLVVALGAAAVDASAQPVSEAKPVGAMTPAQPASIPTKPLGDLQLERALPAPSDPIAAVQPPVPAPPPEAEAYDPSGRRDPFTAFIQMLEAKKDEANLPPLQRVALTEINLVGVVWGGYGYTAMVQTPDGKGYSVRNGTPMGPNNGVVTSVTERGLIVVERFTDIYGKKQEREFVRLLHQKEGSE
ncbi:MAG: pilus assembly protein PilP [Nitrospiraceae bacterium]